MDRLRLGLILLAVAYVAWLVAVLANGYEGYTLALVVALAGSALAAWAVPEGRRILGVISFVAAALGICLFYDFSFFEGLPSTAGAIVVAGSLLSAAGAALGHRALLPIGLGVTALGAFLWIVADGTSGLEWQVGNVLAFAGATLAALGAATREAPA
ncbi:MAG: hypothetical protein QOC71_979 [Thermoplasmata archaeon]|jgi:hypothetical protein|nr:hypothetical protein [Thermoplasmata archaeon]